MAKQALGRGLGALIGGGSGRSTPPKTDAPAPAKAEAAPAVAPPPAAKPATPPPAAESPSEPGRESEPVAAGDRVQRIALGKVSPSPLQPRREFGGEPLRELMESIREHGIIQPLIVREVKGGYELIAGERRWRASRELGLGEVPVIVRRASDRDVLEMALIENLQREDLNPIEEAEAYVRLAREFKLRQEDIAQRVGRSRASVANSMRLLDLPSEVRNLVTAGSLSAGHAKVLLGLKDPHKIEQAARQVVMRQLSVRATEKLVELALRKADQPTLRPAGHNPVQAALRDVEKRLRDRFTSNIAVRHGEHKGRIEIEYYGNDDLNRILDLLGVEEADFAEANAAADTD